MAIDEMTDLAQIVSAVAAVFTFVTAGVAAWIAIAQIQANRSQARETIAMDTHRQLLCLCIERPEFSSSALMLKTLKRKDFVRIEQDLTPESERALWFASYLLNAIEQILESNPCDPAWRRTMAAQAEYHRPLLEEVWPNWAEHYGSRLRDFMRNDVGLCS